MIKDIQELNFPSYATMSAATCLLQDMGDWTITSQIKIDGQIKPDFSYDWAVIFQGHKYIQPLRKPQGSKENTSLNSLIDLTFRHWAIYQLKRWYFFTVQPTEAGVAWPYKYIASVSLNLGDFCTLFGQVLAYYYGDAITIDLNPDWEYKAEPEVVDISYSYIWDVLAKFYEIYGVRWEIKPDDGPDKYVIMVGYPTTEQSHIFEYGFEGGLLKVERQVQSEDIFNMFLGRGGEKNLPYRYFKDTDPNNPDFKADPDWIEELANVYFSNLMPATFRSYVQGWKAAHLDATDSEGKLLYEGYEPVGEDNAYAPWAYRKGYTDENFDPVEYVADEITIDPEIGDKYVVISPTYTAAVKKGSSIDEYGPLMNGLDNNADIFPTIQGTGMDIAVDVEQIESDDVEQATENDAQLANITGSSATALNVQPSSYTEITLPRTKFTVPEGKTGNLEIELDIARVTDSNSTTGRGGSTPGNYDPLLYAEITASSIKLYDAETYTEHSAGGIPAGDWYYEAKVTVHNISDNTLNIMVKTAKAKLLDATLGDDGWKNTFDIWVKNIWGTTKESNETETEYSERVWRPILGDREGNEATVMFTTGQLAVSEDYEFKIPKGAWPVHDESKTLDGAQSHWRITLAKSDADLETIGLYVPSTMRQGSPGDRFVFLGIDMPHEYVLWAEERVDEWKKDELSDVKDIKPTWVVETDRVRMNNEGKDDALVRNLHVGDTLRLADKRFIDGAYETLYLQSMTYTYREPTKDDAALNPDLEIVLSDSYSTSVSPVATLRGEVSALAKQVGSISNVEQIVRAVGDKLYLRKDGIPDRSVSPTEFLSLLTSGDFRSGFVGGQGWGFFKDENGNWVLETDRVNVRREMSVYTLVINQVEGRSGIEIDTAAYMVVARVAETEDGYICYFDQKGGSVQIFFEVNDIAFCNRWSPNRGVVESYRRRITEVGPDYIKVTKPLSADERPDNWPDSGVNGSGIPYEGDTIIQYGNYNDTSRQYVKVRDVIGGGYEMYLEGLNTVSAAGKAYYFVGRQNGMYGNRPRWFIGDENGFLEWVNGVMKIKGMLSVQSTIGDKPIEQYISDLVQENSDLGYLANTFQNGEETVIGGGVVMTNVVGVREGNSNNLEAFLNGSDIAKDNTHGKLIMAGGIPKGNGTLDERARQANTRIYEDGTIKTKKLEAENGVQVGEFKIEQDGFVAERWIPNTTEPEESTKIIPNLIRFFGKEKLETLIGNTVSLATSACIAFRTKIVSKLTTNIGLYINVDRNGSLSSNDTIPASGDFAIAAKHGQYAGLRPMTTVIGYNGSMNQEATLTEYEHTILICNTSIGQATNFNVLLHLPASPEDGQEYVVIKQSDTTLKIQGTGNAIYVLGKATYPPTMPATWDDEAVEVRLVFHSEINSGYYTGVWVCTWHFNGATKN